MTTAKEAIIEYAKKNGYTGLYEPDSECGCAIEDCCLCDSFNPESCKFGDMVKCVDCDKKDTEEGCMYYQEGAKMCVRPRKLERAKKC